jgi:hypothetical protein
MTTQTIDRPIVLAKAEIARFHDLGYHLLPGFLDGRRIEALKREVDQFIQDQSQPVDPYATTAPALKKLQLEYHEHGQLLIDPVLLGLLRQLMNGSDFALHHLHTARHDPGCPGVNWHHDYEQIPQTNRSHLMVHVFYYLNGLNGEIGDLQILPHSHQRVMERNAMDFCGSGPLPGMLTFDDLPPGSAVIVHSAVLHSRLAKPGGEGRQRYFIDSSYCQAGVTWPSFDAERQQEIARRALACGLGNGGSTDFLFDPRAFFPGAEGWKAMQAHKTGSVALRLPQ